MLEGCDTGGRAQPRAGALRSRGGWEGGGDMLRGRDEGRGNGTKLGRSKPAGGWNRCAPAIVEAMTGASQRAATRACGDGPRRSWLER